MTGSIATPTAAARASWRTWIWSRTTPRRLCPIPTLPRAPSRTRPRPSPGRRRPRATRDDVSAREWPSQRAARAPRVRGKRLAAAPGAHRRARRRRRPGVPDPRRALDFHLRVDAEHGAQSGRWVGWAPLASACALHGADAGCAPGFYSAYKVNETRIKPRAEGEGEGDSDCPGFRGLVRLARLADLGNGDEDRGGVHLEVLFLR